MSIAFLFLKATDQLQQKFRIILIKHSGAARSLSSLPFQRSIYLMEMGRFFTGCQVRLSVNSDGSPS